MRGGKETFWPLDLPGGTWYSRLYGMLGYVRGGDKGRGLVGEGRWESRERQGSQYGEGR